MFKKMLAAAGLVALLGAAMAANTPQKVNVSMYEMGFKVSQKSLKAGVPTEITLTNAGKVDHEFQAYITPKAAPKGEAGWDGYMEKNTLWLGGNAKLEINGKLVKGDFMEVQLKPGDKAVIRFTPKKTGSFELGCHEPGHYEAGMKDALIVL